MCLSSPGTTLQKSCSAEFRNSEYVCCCLSFIEEALKTSNTIEVFVGDSVKGSCGLYKVALGGDPVNRGHCGFSLGDGRIIHDWSEVRIDDCLQIEKIASLPGNHPNYIG